MAASAKDVRKGTKLSITLPRVRLSYCHVFRKGTFQNQENSKYDCTMLLSKTDEVTVEKIRRACVSALIEKYGSKDSIPKPFTKLVGKDSFGSSERCFFRDGDDQDDENYSDHWVVKASNKARPPTFDRNRDVTTEDDGLIYSGAYADVIVSVWVQDHQQYGKRLNANLDGLRFREHGEPLSGGGSRAAADDFEELDDDDDVEDVDGDDDLDEI